jgi:hypothetical protein
VPLVLQVSSVLAAAALFGRLVIQPMVRLGRDVRDQITESRATHDDVWAMTDGFIDHEFRIRRLEVRGGIPPGPTRPRPQQRPHRPKGA